MSKEEAGPVAETKATLRFWFSGLLCLFLAGSCGVCRAQVANDDIEHRRVLHLEETIVSNTTGCTVQRNVVDEGLTGKCIEYHNDQWFEFTPAQSGRYFVNISQQQCRDVRGVQLVVLTGTPGKPATYQVLSCTSLSNQDDIFVALENLRSGQPYLLDVDGYLKDFCQFSLQVSTQAKGLPVATAGPVTTTSLPSTSRIVHIEWTLPDSLSNALRCRVLRREAHAFRSAERRRLPVGSDTYGGQASAYAVTDTLPSSGAYLYQIVADVVAGQAPVLLRQQWVTSSKLIPTDQAPHIVVPLQKYPRSASLSVIVSDPTSGRVLLARQLINQPNDPRQGWLPVSQWQDAGIQKIKVEISWKSGRGRPVATDELFVSLPSQAALR
jgi:hypothetical protein